MRLNSLDGASSRGMKFTRSALLFIVALLFLYGCIINKQVRKESVFLTPRNWLSIDSSKLESGMSKQEILYKFVEPEKRYYENDMEVLVYNNNSIFLHFSDNALIKIVVEERDTITDKLNRLANPIP